MSNVDVGCTCNPNDLLPCVSGTQTSMPKEGWSCVWGFMDDFSSGIDQDCDGTIDEWFGNFRFR